MGGSAQDAFVKRWHLTRTKRGSETFDNQNKKFQTGRETSTMDTVCLDVQGASRRSVYLEPKERKKNGVNETACGVEAPAAKTKT